MGGWVSLTRTMRALVRGAHICGGGIPRAVHTAPGTKGCVTRREKGGVATQLAEEESRGHSSNQHNCVHVCVRVCTCVYVCVRVCE